MNKLFMFASLLLATMLAPLSTPLIASKPEAVTVDAWSKSKTGIWVGQYGIKYKKDKKGTVTQSKDGKAWKPAKDNMWLDHLGKWMKIMGNKVQWSNDSGKTWSETPDWKWQGGDGKWYKFDKSFSLLVINS
ncbi:MAG: hypothetical protein ACHQRM_06135 [Bacteroidia bacterium]